MNKKERVMLQVNISDAIGFPMKSEATVLDVGCGNGDAVKEFRECGYLAYGCDIKFKKGENVDLLKAHGWIRLMDPHTYTFPFNDNQFDWLVSDQVLEHVADYSSSMREMYRVLKPGGICLHIFPSRYMPIEPHVYVPLATVIQDRWWLDLWAHLGIRTIEQRGLKAAEVARSNYEYLHSNTNYLTKAQIERYVSEYFCDIRFCENLFLKYSRRGRWVYRISGVFPALANLYGTFRNRVMVCRKPL